MIKEITGVSIRPASGESEDLREFRERLAEQLRIANTEGVTRWLGLEERLDLGGLNAFGNYRTLLRERLRLKLNLLHDLGDTTENLREKRMVARELLLALNAYEQGLQDSSEQSKKTGGGDAA